MTNPKVSVVIPIYRVEPYLRQCLDSVAAQTLRDLEVICVDDGSPDRSGEIAAEYAARDHRFRLIRKENGGVSSARNAGLEAARGEYVYFLDSDDYIAPETLQSLVETAVDRNLDIVYFNAESFFENTTIRAANEGYISYYTRQNGYPEVCTGQAMFAKMRSNKEYRENVCIQFFRRALLEKGHLSFYPGIIHEDLLFTFQCAMLAQRVGYLDKAFLFRRVRSNSIVTSSKTMRNVEGYLVTYAEALVFLRNIRLEEQAAAPVREYLYTAIFQKACKMWSALYDWEKKQPLTAGNAMAEHLLYAVRKTVKTENVLEGLRAETAWTRKRPFRKLAKFLRLVSEKGCLGALGETVRRLGGKLWRIPQLLRSPFVKLRQKTGGKAPLVSYILPVYNVEKYLPQCLDSLLCQTMSHIEILCVDDGSTDRSPEILRAYSEKDSRVKVFTQSNRFAGAARNLGLSKATGEYVAFLDSDDFFEKDLAEATYYAAKVRRADAVICGARVFDEQTQEARKAQWLYRSDYVPKKQPFSRKDCPNTLFQITTPAPWTKLFRRKFILDRELRFQEIHNTNDVFFTYAALAQAKRITTVDRVLVNYRRGMDTNLQSVKGKAPLCFFEAYKALRDYLREQGLLEELRQSYVNAAASSCGHSLDTGCGPEARERVAQKLRGGGLEELELLGHEPSYYYAGQRYAQIMKLMEEVGS